MTGGHQGGVRQPPPEDYIVTQGGCHDPVRIGDRIVPGGAGPRGRIRGGGGFRPDCGLTRADGGRAAHRAKFRPRMP